MVTLDGIFQDTPLGLLKIDVEGFEKKVLEGGIRLLEDSARKPRMIFIEVHPYAWVSLGTTAESLLGLLKKCGYRISDSQGHPITQIERWGQIVASRMG